MRSSQLRARLLPRSGTGVIGPWLVFGPAGAGSIRFDVRVLDSVEIGETPGVIVLSRGDCAAAVMITDGPEAAAAIVDAIALVLRGVVEPAEPELSPPAAADGVLVITSSSDTGVPSPHDPLAGRRHVLARSPLTIGRTDDNDIAIVHRSMSRRHARITRDPATHRYAIADLQAENGVRINGVESREATLEDGDCVDLGHVRMRFEAPDEAVSWLDQPTVPDSVLVIGSEQVRIRGDRVHIGALQIACTEISERAERGELLVLSRGRTIQAALVSLVIAATAPA